MDILHSSGPMSDILTDHIVGKLQQIFFKQCALKKSFKICIFKRKYIEMITIVTTIMNTKSFIF